MKRITSYPQRICRLAGALFLLAVVSACATLPAPPESAAVQLANVPAFAQQELQCGPAALASVLSASGVAETPDSLKPDLFIPARKGSLQVELAAQARLRERVPLTLQPREPALVAALQAGQPVLVLLNLGVRSYPIWHYAALTGYDPAEGYTLNNGKAKPETMRRSTFLRRWQWGGSWALTVHPAGEPPPYAEAAQWVAAAAPLQRSHPLAAETAYQAAVQRWPESPLAWAALGEASFTKGDLQASQQQLSKAVALAPTDAALINNLASVQLARGCVSAADRTLQTADLASAEAAVAVALRGTQKEIEAAGKDRCPD